MCKGLFHFNASLWVEGQAPFHEIDRIRIGSWEQRGERFLSTERERTIERKVNGAANQIQQHELPNILP